MSLRIKLMLALFVTGLAAVAMVGGLTFYSVNSKFDSIRNRSAAEHFHHFMTAYLTKYGDWDTAISSESFDRFVQRTEAENGPPKGERASDMLERMPPAIDLLSHGQPLQEGGERERPAPPPPAAAREAVRNLALPANAAGIPPLRADTPQRGEPEGRRDGPPRDGQRPPPRNGAQADNLPPPGGQPRMGPDGRPEGRDGLRLPPPDGIRPPPPDGQPWPPTDGLRPPPRDGMRPPPPDGMRPRDGARPRAPSGDGPPPEGGPGQRLPREGERPQQIHGSLQGEPAGSVRAFRAAYEARPASAAASQPEGDMERMQPPARRDTPGAPGTPEERAGRPRRADDGRGPGGRPGNPPPFRFVLTDQDYVVRLGAGLFASGTVLPEDARNKARPIIVNDKTVAYVSTEGVVTPSKQEQEFLDAMQSSLLAGAGGAAVLALGLGLLLSRGLSTRLSKLTAAVRAMQGGALRQQVPAHGKDEVAALAGAFNEMSEQLARSHEELKASHQTILEQAVQLKELSIRDALTTLYNRRHFDEQANTLYHQAVRHKRPISLVIGDIDFFKRINDNFSHATGDVVLRHVGAILRQHVRLSDLVARYGGEEFVLALPDTDLPQAAALCDKLRTLIESYPWHEVHPNLKVTMSMGVFADYAVGTAEAMLQKADEFLYQAKETGRNRVCHG